MDFNYYFAVLSFVLVFLTHLSIFDLFSAHSLINLASISYLLYYFTRVKACYTIPGY